MTGNRAPARRWRALALAACLLGTACGGGTDDAPTQGQSLGNAPTSTTGTDAPAILTMVGSSERKPVTNVVARQGHFQLKMLDGMAVLHLDDKPVSYESGTGTEFVQANVAITFLGVLELAGESVAWVNVTGGTACPSSNFLVAARKGQYPRVYSIDGCSEGGTMVRQGDRILFEMGVNETGQYAGGQLTMDPNGMMTMGM